MRRRHHSVLDQIFITTQPPAIDGLASANLTATTADLTPRSIPTASTPTYRFEYGPTTAYGQVGTGPRRHAQRLQRRPGDRRPPRQPDPPRRLPLPPRRDQRRRHHRRRRPHLQLLPARLPQRKRPPADPGQLPARLPRLRARLARRCRRHPALPGRAQHRLRHQPLSLLLHRALVDDSRTPAATRSTASATSTSPPAPTPAGSPATSAFREPGRDRRRPAAWACRTRPPASRNSRYHRRPTAASSATRSRTTSSPTPA